MMNFNLIDNNVFLKTLYPSGISGKVFIGNFSFSIGNRVEIDLHTRELPERDVEKWGEKSVTYNTVVIHLTSNLLKDARIINPNLFEMCEVRLEQEPSGFVVISAFGKNWEFFVRADGFLFNKCSVYIDC